MTWNLPPSNGSADDNAPAPVPSATPAPRRGPVAVATRPVSEFDDVALHGFVPDAPPTPPEHEGITMPFPVDDIDLMRPPGFVGHVTNWIDGQCRYPRRRLSVASAIVAVGNIGGLRHEDERDGITANMLAFCVAASSTGKEAVQQAVAQMHVVAGIQGALQGGIKSEQEIMRNLIEHQAAFYVVDEIGIFLTKVRNAQKKGGAAYLEGVFGAIMSGYSKANSRLLLQGDTKRELRKMYAGSLSRSQADGDDAGEARAHRMLDMIDEGLERPFLSVMGYTTPSTFDQVMDGETATQGFVGRALIVVEPDINPRPRKAFKRAEMPLPMHMRLASLYAGLSSAHDDAGGRVEFMGERKVIHTTYDADEMLTTCLNWLIDYADDMGEATGEASVAMVRRSYEMIAKMSFIMGMADGERNAEHVRWSFAYVFQELNSKIKLVFANDNEKSRPADALAARIVNALDDVKGTSSSVLANRMKKSRPDVDAILGQLEARGIVKMSGDGRKYKGKTVVTWIKTGLE
jgi:hypothetical protein